MKSFFFLFAYVFLAGAAHSQSLPASYVEAIHSKDQKIKTIFAIWNLKTVHFPAKNFDVEEFVARGRVSAKGARGSEQYVKQIEQADRETATRIASGDESTSVINIIRKGETIRVGIDRSLPTSIGSPPSLTTAHEVDYFDGVKSIRLQKAIDMKGQKDMWYGNLLVDGKEILPGLGAKNVSFLTGSSFHQPTISNPILLSDDSNFVSVGEKTSGDTPRLTRTTYRKSDWAISTKEVVNLVNNKVLIRYSVASWVVSPDGSTLPSKFSIQRYKETGDVSERDDFELSKYSINTQDGLDVLNKPLPVGSVIDDYRFDPRPGARYKIRKGGIPSDETVEKLVSKREVNQQGKIKFERLVIARNYVLPVGALLLVGGLFWSRRTRQTKT